VGAFGAGVTLAMASSILLLVVSSVVAFNGWPDDLKGASAPQVARLAGTPASSPAEQAAATRPAALELPAAKPARDRTGTRADRAAVAGAEEKAPVTDDGTGTTTSGATTTSSSQSANGAPAGTQAKGPTTKPVTDAVRDTSKAVGDTVDAVAPGAGGSLESVGAAGADTVDEVGKTVDGAVQQLLP
jgi:hypothetical protein